MTHVFVWVMKHYLIQDWIFHFGLLSPIFQVMDVLSSTSIEKFSTKRFISFFLNNYISRRKKEGTNRRSYEENQN